MDHIIGSVNTYEDRGVDENGKHFTRTLRGVDVKGVTDDWLNNLFAMFTDPTAQAIAFENTSSNENLGVTPTSTYPDHPNMPSQEYVNPKRLYYFPNLS